MTSARPLMLAVRRMLDDADVWEAFCLRIKSRRGWRFSDREAVRRCRQIFNGEVRFLGVEELMLVFEMCGGLDYVTPILQREALRAEDSGQTGIAGRPMRAVRRGRVA